MGQFIFKKIEKTFFCYEDNLMNVKWVMNFENEAKVCKDYSDKWRYF